MTEICPKIQCTGCGVCAGVCPMNCIDIKGDEMGYLYPSIDNSRCIDCKLCQRTCPNNRDIIFHEPQAVYAGWAKNSEERQTSISGGIASVLARHITENGGVAYGAVGKSSGQIEHQRADYPEDVNKFKMSKYAQSTIHKETYQLIKKDLKEKKKVAFFGTPCQNAAVKAMNPQNENLLCIEIVCHGVPSCQLLQDHIKLVTGKHINQISQFSTRDNEGHYLTLKEGERILYKESNPKDMYMHAFINKLFFRPSCYQCHYARKDRQSDLTLGDFWGLQETKYPTQKVSLILENSNIGSELLEEVKDKIFLDKRSFQEAAEKNGQLTHPSTRPKYYYLFRTLYLKYGYQVAITRSLRTFYFKYGVYKSLSKIPGFYRLGLNRLFKV